MVIFIIVITMKICYYLKIKLEGDKVMKRVEVKVNQTF